MKKLITLGLILFIASSLQAKIYYVTTNATAIASPEGVSDWQNPVTLSSAIDSAKTTTDEVWIKSGTYYIIARTSYTSSAVPPVTTIFRAAITINSGTKQIYGGFAGTETDKNQRLRSDLDNNGIIEPWEFTNQTILDASQLADYPTPVTSRKEIYKSGTPTTTGLSISTPNKKTVVSIEGGTNHILDGVVVQNGKYDGDSYGSGINLTGVGTVRNCIVRKCSVTRKDDLTNGASISAGAAILIANPLAVVDGCLIEDNTAGPLLPGAYTSGAGVCLSQGTLSNSVVRNNFSSVRSAAANQVGFSGGELEALGLVDYPTANQSGNMRAAGVYMSGGNAAGKRAPLLINCIVANNEGVSYDANATGAAFFAAGVSVDVSGVIMNSTIVNNKLSFATLNTSNALPLTALEGVGVFIRSSTPYTTTTPAQSKNSIASIYNSIVLGNLGTAATLPTKADISMKANVPYAPNEASSAVTNASTLQPFNIMDVKNCIVGGESINCDPLSSTGKVVGNDNVLSATAVTFATNQKTMTLTIPEGCVFGQTTAILKVPNAVIGSSLTDASIKTANWRLKDATYVSAGIPVSASWTNYNSTNVGTTYTYSSPTTDFLGNPHTANPAIGAILDQGSLTTAINTVSKTKNTLEIMSDRISSSEVVPSISIYTISGMLVSKASNTNSLSISNLNKGIYIAVAGNSRLKFVK